MSAPAGSGQPYDVYARLEDPVGVLAIALAQWETRDDSKPQPEVRQAARPPAPPTPPTPPWTP